MKNKILLDFFRQNKLAYGIGFIFMFLASYIQTLFPKVLGDTMDRLKVSGFDPKPILINVLWILLIAVATFVCTFIWRNLVIGNARNLECYLRERLFQHFQRLAPEFYSQRKTGDLIAYAINDISAVRMTFGPATAMSFNTVVICASSIYLMLTTIDVRLTLVTLLPLPVVIYLMLTIGKKIQLRFKKVQENFAAISDKVQENIYGIRVIKSFVQEEQEIRNFERLSDRMMEANIQMVKTSSYLAPIIELGFSVSFILNLILGGNMVLRGTISLGDFVAFNSFLAIIMAPLLSIGRVIANFQRGMASLERLNEIFSVPVQPGVIANETALTRPIHGTIEFRALSFHYPESPQAALTGISLKIGRGQTLGIIGKTGSGKSTLANLLLKLYPVDSGALFLDGTDINDYSLAAIRDSIGFVPQETFLFSATIKENISFFKESYSDDVIEKVSQYSHIYDSIVGFPDGFDTQLGERGVNLSGGQKQRIAIARAIIRDPAILILDDALSAVDTVTEAQILRDLKTLRRNKTTLIISHRTSAVADADLIVVLDQGRIREQGTHSELLQKGGLYYDIFMEQAKDNPGNPALRPPEDKQLQGTGQALPAL